MKKPLKILISRCARCQDARFELFSEWRQCSNAESFGKTFRLEKPIPAKKNFGFLWITSPLDHQETHPNAETLRVVSNKTIPGPLCVGCASAWETYKLRKKASQRPNFIYVPRHNSLSRELSDVIKCFDRSRGCALWVVENRLFLYLAHDVPQHIVRRVIAPARSSWISRRVNTVLAWKAQCWEQGRYEGFRKLEKFNRENPDRGWL